MHGGALKQAHLENLDKFMFVLEGYLRSSYVKILTDDNLFNIFLDNNKIEKYFNEIMFA